MCRLIGLILILIKFSSCATFIEKPKSIKKWSKVEASSCHKKFKIIYEKNVNYHLGEKEIYKCDVLINETSSATCKKVSDFFMDSIVSEKSFTNQHETLIKKLKGNFPCLEYTKKEHADYSVSIKSEIYESDNLAWAMLSGVTLTIVPFRTKQRLKHAIEVKNLRSGDVNEITDEGKVTLWMQILLLPLMPFIGDGPAHDKLLAHQQSLIYESILAMDSSNLGKQ